jgi:AcrR family transcriptional regulator
MQRDIKQRIIEATIRLIEEKGSNIEEITVREICSAAGTGVSQINYHFQTKERLIEQCVQSIIGNVIARFDRASSPLSGLPAVERLKQMFASTCRFLYANENISRVSMLTDHRSARTDDNTAQTIAAYLPLVEAACRERGTAADPRRVTVLMVSAVQTLFLRTDIIKEELGIDLRSEDERRPFIDDYLEQLLGAEGESVKADS